jgi:hypothetical protein
VVVGTKSRTSEGLPRRPFRSLYFLREEIDHPRWRDYQEHPPVRCISVREEKWPPPTFRRLFEPAFDAVLLAAGILDDGDARWDAVFDAVHAPGFDATCEILGVRSTPCPAHAKQ